MLLIPNTRIFSYLNIRKIRLIHNNFFSNHYPHYQVGSNLSSKKSESKKIMKEKVFLNCYPHYQVGIYLSSNKIKIELKEKALNITNRKSNKL